MPPPTRVLLRRWLPEGMVVPASQGRETDSTLREWARTSVVEMSRTLREAERGSMPASLRDEAVVQPASVVRVRKSVTAACRRGRGIRVLSAFYAEGCIARLVHRPTGAMS